MFAKALIAEAEADERIVAITAAMPSGTGLDKFAERFPARCFDVGIAEQHAVTFAAGLACEGLKPFAAIYSTFLQRAYDQVVHDVAIQRLPVRFALDRAGLVGADGATHAGSFDLAYLGCLPGFVIMAAADEAELMHMVATGAAIDDRPSAVRYPRGEGVGVALPERGEVLAIGRGRVLREGDDDRAPELRHAAAGMPEGGGRAGRRWAWRRRWRMRASPSRWTRDLIERLAREHEVLVTVEEGSVGGFASQVLHHLALKGLLDHGLKLRPMVLPDRFIDHDTPASNTTRPASTPATSSTPRWPPSAHRAALGQRLRQDLRSEFLFSGAVAQRPREP